MAVLHERLTPWKRRVVGILASLVIGLLASTWRKIYVNKQVIEQLQKDSLPFVLMFWHGEMLSGWYEHRNKEYAALVSLSKDGDVLAEVLAKWKYHVVRGSSSKGGKEARKLMEEIVTTGSVLVVTPDGPRGPAQEMKMGAIRTAQKTNVPLVMVRFRANRVKKLKSWDRFMIPLPFSLVSIEYSDPFYVPDNLQGDALNSFRDEIQKKFSDIS